MSDIDTQPLCSSSNVFAARLDGTPEPTADSTCMAYSGGNALDDIETMAIKGAPATVNRLTNNVTDELDGVKLTYFNGALCPINGEKTRLSLNMYCNSTMAMDEFDYSYGMLGNEC